VGGGWGEGGGDSVGSVVPRVGEVLLPSGVSTIWEIEETRLTPFLRLIHRPQASGATARAFVQDGCSRAYGFGLVAWWC
jgi:hypothetical protein